MKKLVVIDRGWKAIKNAVAMAGDKHAKVGVFSARGGGLNKDGKPEAGTVLEVATIHEYGAPKAKIPQRSFIGGGINHGKDEIMKIQEKAARAAFTGKVSFEVGLEAIGLKAQSEIKNYITQGDNLTPLSQRTIDAKGSSRPLVDTGQLVNAITYEVSK